MIFISTHHSSNSRTQWAWMLVMVHDTRVVRNQKLKSWALKAVTEHKYKSNLVNDIYDK